MTAETRTREYRTVDKSEWDDGPWQAEPDKMQWVDEATGLDCLIVRNRMGALCGYVGVPEAHPFHGKSYDDLNAHLDVHGGLTYADACQEGAPEDTAICHVPFVGRSDHVWWLGFDCAHAFDYRPIQAVWRKKYGQCFERLECEEYRDLAYVEAECARLAAQLAKLAA